MKRLLLLVVFYILCCTAAHAQLPPGSIAPNFTGTDINGNTYTLYDLLDQGKTVYLDIFATWCGPCWNYHNTHALKTIWDTYGPPGTDEAFVMAIEGDASTNTACLYGPSGCVGGTQGNWVAGTPYPFIDDASIASLYGITYYPTIYIICPADKKVYETGQLSATSLWQYRTTHCPMPPLSAVLNSVQNVQCINTSTGAIDITVNGAISPYTYNWSNGKKTQDISSLAAGNYTCTVTSTNGATTIIGPITVAGPPTALAVTIQESIPAGCNGVTGSLTVQGSGGWGNYSYNWNNGQSGPEANQLAAGTYTVSVTDDNNCTKTLTATVAPPTYPIAQIAAPTIINCIHPTIQLNGGASSTGSNFTYLWTPGTGGVILSGATTLTPTVSAAASYVLVVTNTNSTCTSIAVTAVQANLTPPSANAGPAFAISCAQPNAVLQGTGSSGNNFSYLWTTSGGGNIASGANTLTPTVNASGTYTLKVTNATNGCTKTSTTTVTGSAVPLLTLASNPISCTQPSVTINSSTNAATPTYAWTGPNGFTSTAANPTVNQGGDYSLVLTDQTSGCTATSTHTVVANTTAPGASATGGTLNCVVSSVRLMGNSTGQHSTYNWSGPNGYSSTQQNPDATVVGSYALVVMDTLNGCTSNAATSIALNNTAPTAAASTPGSLNCNAAQLSLNGSASSQGSNFSYNWTTANGHIVSGGNSLTPLVDAPGDYALMVSNADNGCTSTASTGVIQHAPVSSGILSSANATCNNASNGSASATAAGGNGVYAYAWSNGATSASVNNLPAGSYMVVVTDGENCSSTSAVTIAQPDPLHANAAATAQSANGVNDGTAMAVPAGGTAGYAYTWSNGATNPALTGLAPGNYTVTVADANACTDVQTVTVNAFNCTLVATAAAGNVSCFGQTNGTATVNLTGAANPVTFAWSTGETTASIANLAPGTYSVNVMDGHNCPASINVTVGQPSPLEANATATGITAAGALDGTATANPNGGNAAYAYAWSTGATTPSITGLAPDTYTVTVTDANNCTNVQSVVVNPFLCTVSAQSSVANVTCAGGSNGSATIALSGGTAPFNYLWSNGNTTSSVNNLSGGLYLATVTDANGCQSTTSAQVAEPAPFDPWSTTVVNPVCPNASTGAATANITGATPPYAYQWSNGATTATVENLAPGTYTVVATDQNNCQSTTSVTLTATDNEPPTVSIQPASITLNNLGLAPVTLTALSAVVADNCTVANTKIDPPSFDCTQLGSHQVTVTVIDEAGLATSAVTTVTVVDNSAPIVTCPASVTACFADNIISYPAPVAQDNCLSAGGQWNLVSGLPSGSVFPAGTTTEIYSYTDASGNQGSCSFEVSIVPPVVFGTPLLVDDVNHLGQGSISLTTSGGVEPFTYEWSHDGQVVGHTANLSGLSEGTYTLIVTDANGCTYNAGPFVIHSVTGVKEPLWLTSVKLQPNPTSGLTRVLFGQSPETTLETSVIDATGRILNTQFTEQQAQITIDCTALPQGIYTIRFRTGTETGVRKLVVNR